MTFPIPYHDSHCCISQRTLVCDTHWSRDTCFNLSYNVCYAIVHHIDLVRWDILLLHLGCLQIANTNNGITHTNRTYAGDYFVLPLTRWQLLQYVYNQTYNADTFAVLFITFRNIPSTVSDICSHISFQVSPSVDKHQPGMSLKQIALLSKKRLFLVSKVHDNQSHSLWACHI